MISLSDLILIEGTNFIKKSKQVPQLGHLISPSYFKKGLINFCVEMRIKISGRKDLA
jgi:hypothetical protein